MISAYEVFKIINNSKLSLENARQAGLLPITAREASNLLRKNGIHYDRHKKCWTQNPTQNLDTFNTETDPLIPR